jgi:outer membrane protein assembly factor BamA
MRLDVMVFICLSLSLQLGPESRATACSQSNNERKALMQQAERQRFTVRRVEFLGLTYTRDDVVRARLIKFQQEGDLFSSAQLEKALKSMSKLRREIYPVRLSDIEVHLNEAEQTVDIAICFKPKRR